VNRLQALHQAEVAAVTGQGPLAPGAVQVRLTGGQDDVSAVAAVLASCPGVEILTGPDGPYRNRRQSGHRLPHRAAHPAAHHQYQHQHTGDERSPR
jgi:hypothetical protein